MWPFKTKQSKEKYYVTFAIPVHKWVIHTAEKHVVFCNSFEDAKDKCVKLNNGEITEMDI